MLKIRGNYSLNAIIVLYGLIFIGNSYSTSYLIIFISIRKKSYKMKIQFNPNVPNLYENKNILSKLVFLSYHIASYKTISESMGFDSPDISVDEIYDFIKDLKLDMTNRVPDIDRMEISFCFNILKSMGICHSK